MPALVLLALTPDLQAASVQLSGNLGVSIVRYHGTRGARTQMQQDVLDATALRILGTRDLGAGAQAVFKIAVPVDLSGGGWGGKLDDSYVGLDSRKWGRMTFGRQFPSGIDRISGSLDAFEVAGSSAHQLPLALLATNAFNGYSARTDNSIKYTWENDGKIFGMTVAAAEAAGVSDSFGLALRNGPCQLAATWIHYRGGTALPGGDQAFAGAGANCDTSHGRLYAAAYYRRLRGDASAAVQRNVVIHLGALRRLAERVILTGGVYVDRGIALGSVAGRDGRKLTAVLASSYAFSPKTRITALVFGNWMKRGYRGYAVNADALDIGLGAGRASGAALTMSMYF
ncbi:MAG TPA: porin [Telluria sp.]|nr:porin [Telluria sp.]